MKVLFVTGGNSNKFEISPIIEAQANSLRRNNIEIEYFLIQGKGISGYLKNVITLRKFLKKNSFDIIHAHYSFSGVISSLATKKTPILVSFLGSDINRSNVLNKIIIKYNFIFKWKAIIVKSLEMKLKLKSKIEPYIIPNGVDLNNFQSLDKIKNQIKLDWNTNKFHILFLADPSRPEKNYELLKKSIELINEPNYEIHFLENMKHSEIPIWINASDIVTLSSLWEGSPNVIKESMACNKPIVSTNVGDVEWLFNNLDGHFLSDFSIEDYSNKIKSAIQYAYLNKNTNGRERIIQLELDSDKVAKKIIQIYKSI